jgi:hypothetical protein
VRFDSLVLQWYVSCRIFKYVEAYGIGVRVTKVGTPRQFKYYLLVTFKLQSCQCQTLPPGNWNKQCVDCLKWDGGVLLTLPLGLQCGWYLHTGVSHLISHLVLHKTRTPLLVLGNISDTGRRFQFFPSSRFSDILAIMLYLRCDTASSCIHITRRSSSSRGGIKCANKETERRRKVTVFVGYDRLFFSSVNCILILNDVFSC